MATFNYTVDTHPMAQEIGSVSNNVKATTTAVVAMQTAVILAEAQAAEHVCDNVNKGFFALMRSQISQKIAKLQSEVDSHLMQLNQQRKSLLAIKGRMERDYGMISGRYLKLFNGLNANLKQRIFELEKPTIDYAVKEVERISNRTKYLTATVPVNQLESLSMSQKIIASNVKWRGLNVINSMTRFLGDMSEQKRLTNRILLKTGKAVNAEISIPVIICETNYDKHDNRSIEIILNNKELTKNSPQVIKNTIMSEIDGLKWQTAEINQEVKSEFNKILSASSLSQRAKNMAQELFLKNNYQIVQNQ